MLKDQILNTIKKIFPEATADDENTTAVGIKLFTDNDIAIGIFNCQQDNHTYKFQFARWGVLTKNDFIGLPLLFKLHSHTYDEAALSNQAAILHELLLEPQSKSR